MFERIKLLCDKRGISINDLEERLGYSKNTLYRLKKQNPGSEKLTELADYFDVSTDYLLGRDNKNKETLAKQMMFRMDTTGLSEDDILDVQGQVEAFLEFRMEQIKEKRRKENEG